MRYFLDISYNGANYHGWQNQPDAISVQECIEDGLSKILRRKTSIVGSGRTDTGVHASQQIAHFDADEIDREGLAYKLNSFLKPDIAINAIRQVSDDAHARFDATLRSYEYFIHDRKNPFLQGQSHFFRQPLNLQAIDDACKVLLRTKDFESLSKVKTDVTNFNCDVSAARWEKTRTGFLFSISANRFLRGMVRAIVGTFLDIGAGKLSVEDFELVLQQKNRSAAGPSVSPDGLFLSKVEYPDHIYLSE